MRPTVAAIEMEPHAQVLIIGGGINGIATFRDLALQGVDVVLVERNDFCSGASASSSHMIHGGIRYLENGEIRLVRESVIERNRLLACAPHYVRPLKTTVPIFSTFSGVASAPLRLLTHRAGRPRERGALLIKVGLTLYDLFSRAGGRLPRHVFRGRRRTLEELPDLNPDLKYSATYFDASMRDPERLALDVLLDGLAERNARAANYVEAVGANSDGVRLRDVTTGEVFSFTADVIINASGPWADATNGALGLDTLHMGGTKGSHIVLKNEALLAACDGREIFFEHSDGRIVLIYPIKDCVLVGTTDLEADIGTSAVCTETEIDYFFELIRHVFPRIHVDRSSIVYRFAGIRPLPAHKDLSPGFISRDYRIVRSAIPALPESALLTLVGGKWTTFRALGERLSADAMAVLGVERTRDTAELAIGGGKDFPMTPEDRRLWASVYMEACDLECANLLLERYGTRAARIAEGAGPALMEALHHCSNFSAAEITYLVVNEFVVHLSDVVLRRTDIAFTGRLSHALLCEMADVVAGALGWTPAETEREVEDTVALLSRHHGVELSRDDSQPAAGRSA